MVVSKFHSLILSSQLQIELECVWCSFNSVRNRIGYYIYDWQVNISVTMSLKLYGVGNKARVIDCNCVENYFKNI